MSTAAWKHHNVSDNVHDIIRLTDLEHDIMNGPLFNRLHFVYQDSTSFFTWPSMRIQRFEHSLGCMHLAGQMFFNAIENAEKDVIISFGRQMHSAICDLLDRPSYCYAFRPNDSDVLFKKTLKDERVFLEACQKPDVALDGIDAFSFLIPSRTPREVSRTIMCLAEGVRLAGMLHDLGHPPFSHVCEHVLTSLYGVAKSDKYEGNRSARNFTANIDTYLERKGIDEIALHEAIGNRLSELAISQALNSGNLESDSFYFSFTAGLVAKAILNDDGVFGLLHAIVCGTVDADRLDFVQRDSKASGVGSDAMQYGRLIEGLRLMKMDEKSYVFALPTKALPTAEDFLRKRLSNYKTIVFHHRVVKSEVLLEGSLHRLALRYFDANPDGERRHGKECSSLYILPNNVSGLWSPLAESLSNETDVVLTFSQWNDSWLLTMLRDEYTKLKIDGPSDSESTFLKAQLAELFYSEKSYQTVVKRSDDCLVFRQTLRKMIASSRNELSSYLDECESDIGSASFESEDASIDARGIVKALRKVVGLDESSNILRSIDENYSAFRLAVGSLEEKDAESFSVLFRNMVKESLNKNGCSYSDVIVTKNHIKTGIGGDSAQAYFYSGDDSPRCLRDISAVGSVLDREVSDLPAFFVFVLCPEEQSDLCRNDEFFIDLATRVHEFICDCVCNAADFIC